MTAPKNSNEVQLRGCIVCAKIHTMLVVYAPDGSLVGCAVTSHGGRAVPDETHALAACDSHTQDEIEVAYRRWLSREAKQREEEDE